MVVFRAVIFYFYAFLFNHIFVYSMLFCVPLEIF